MDSFSPELVHSRASGSLPESSARARVSRERREREGRRVRERELGQERGELGRRERGGGKRRESGYLEKHGIRDHLEQTFHCGWVYLWM